MTSNTECCVFLNVVTLFMLFHLSLVMVVMFRFPMSVHTSMYFFLMALQPQFGPWPTSMNLSVSLQFSRSWTFGRTPLAGDQLVARPLPVHKHRKTHIHKH
jgi:hypothetical protein